MSLIESQAAASAAALFRVLVVDDEDEVPAEVTAQLADDPRLQIEVAATQEEAIEQLKRCHFDAVFIDIELDKPAGGYEVLRWMGDEAPRAGAIIVTRHADERLRKVVGMPVPRIVKLLEKDDLGSGWAREALRDSLANWETRAVETVGVDQLLEMLENRGSRIPGWRGRDDAAFEVDRLFRQLFGGVEGLGQRVRVRIEPIERQGLSAAVTVAARVEIGHDRDGTPVEGAVTVLKIGPIGDIREERDRYNAFVKYGVRQNHRVELLDEATWRALGAICYSFAGGVFGNALTALDDLLLRPEDKPLVSDVLTEMFGAASRNWYRIQLPPMAAGVYFKDHGRLDLPASYERLNGGIARLANRFREIRFERVQTDRDGRLDIDCIALTLPARKRLGAGDAVRTLPTAIVHGDMHGGNVMIEMETAPRVAVRRVCLIDFRSAAPGPRCLDFVALDASLRLADAQLIVQALGAARDQDLDDEHLLMAVQTAAGRVQSERRLLGIMWDGKRVPARVTAWEQHSLHLHQLAYENFGVLAEAEYVPVAIRYALRQMAYSLGPVARIRILTWLSALAERRPTGQHKRGTND